MRRYRGGRFGMADATYYIALGSNMGDRPAYLQAGVDGLRAAGITVTAISPVYETAPWGKTDQAPFLNAVCAVRTDREPTELLAEMLAIESAAGRERREHWGPRTLDMDLIYGEGISCSSAYLTLPHPYFWERAFVLAPLADLLPEFQWRGQAIAARLLELGTSDVQRTTVVLH